MKVWVLIRSEYGDGEGNGELITRPPEVFATRELGIEAIAGYYRALGRTFAIEVEDDEYDPADQDALVYVTISGLDHNFMLHASTVTGA